MIVIVIVGVRLRVRERADTLGGATISKGPMRLRLTTLAIPIAAFCALDACDAGGTCRSTADCEDDEVCGYALADGCNATGKCIAANESCPRGPFLEAVCACDGTSADLWDCFAPGYAKAAVRDVNDLSCFNPDASR